MYEGVFCAKEYCSLKSVLESCSLINIRHERPNSYIEKALHLKVIMILNYICMVLRKYCVDL